MGSRREGKGVGGGGGEGEVGKIFFEKEILFAGFFLTLCRILFS